MIPNFQELCKCGRLDGSRGSFRKEKCAEKMWYQSRNTTQKLIAITGTQKVTLEKEFQRYLKLAHRDVGDKFIVRKAEKKQSKMISGS